MNRNHVDAKELFFIFNFFFLDEAGSSPEDENMEEVVPEDKESSQAPSSVTAPTPEPKPVKTPKKKISKKKTSVANDVEVR